MSSKNITILSIESSCDETAAAVVRNGREVISSVISTQVPIHTLYGGVVPEIASRKHIERVNQVIEQALQDAKMTLDDIDAIAVTRGPGLVGALLVGVSVAKAISYAKNIPLVGVHHIEGHICANYIEYPTLDLVNVSNYGEYEVLGRTRDDAAGEAFDKIGREIGLGYPGGPKIEAAAKEGNPNAVDLPRAVVNDNVYDFSFSGLKSATLNYLNSVRMKGEEVNIPDVAASFQQAVVDALVEHAMLGATEYGAKKLAIAGGVASNSTFREAMKTACEDKGIEFFCPSKILCTDNAAMIGCAGYYEYINGRRDGLDLDAVPYLKLGE